MKFEFTTQPTFTKADNQVTSQTNPLISAFDTMQNMSLTQNGAMTYASSLDKNVDFFFLIGASRGKDLSEVFSKAFAEDKSLAVRVLQYGRDVREGMGERAHFIQLFKLLIQWDKSLAIRVLHNTVEIGRFKDIIEMAFDTVLEKEALRILAKGLTDPNMKGLCAKWMPRQGVNANKLRGYLKMAPKAYRKMLVALSDTVEQKMSNQEWTAIEYAKVPSMASLRYQSAFKEHDPIGYEKYKDELTQGNTKVNSSVVYPHLIVENVLRNTGDLTVLNAQWESLPNYLEGNTENILPLVDVSSSMSSAQVMHIAIALGLYLSERMNGSFKNRFLTFSTTPQLDKVQGVDIREKVRNMHKAHWSGSTNIELAFKAILDLAIAVKAPIEAMPSTLMILSDMEFNRASAWDQTIFQRVKQMYAQAGYTMPKLVFWNLHGRVGNCPVSAMTDGTALISGFNPNIMKAVLANETMTPKSVMLNAILKDRYVS